MRLTAFEEAVIDNLLRGAHPVLSSLRAQVPHVRVSSREHTGSGVFVGLTVSPPPEATAPSLTSSRPRGRIVLSDGTVSAPRLPGGAGSVLFVENGLLACLQIVAHEDTWPADAEVEGAEHGYAREPRDFSALDLLPRDDVTGS